LCPRTIQVSTSGADTMTAASCRVARTRLVMVAVDGRCTGCLPENRQCTRVVLAGSPSASSSPAGRPPGGTIQKLPAAAVYPLG
jgi:hypothetical protein